MEKKLPEGVRGIDGIKPAKPIPDGKEEPNSDQSFQSYMDTTGKTAPKAPGEPGSTAPTPFDLAGGQKSLAPPTEETVAGQMNSASGVLGDIQTQLKTKNLKLKPSQKYLLRNKLNESNSMIRSAATKLGVKVGAPPKMMSRQNPIARFLSMVNDSQVQLEAAQNKIKNLNKEGKMNPGDLLLVQIKISKAQQELEYSSVLLSKAVEDVKTLFNIQI